VLDADGDRLGGAPHATVGFVQESRAEASLEALKQMLVTTATVRLSGGRRADGP